LVHFLFRTAISIANMATTSSSFTESKGDYDYCCQNNQQSPSLDQSVDSSGHGNQNKPDHNQFHFPFGNLLPDIWQRNRKLKAQEKDNKASRLILQ
jgi:hypothetical protein